MTAVEFYMITEGNFNTCILRCIYICMKTAYTTRCTPVGECFVQRSTPYHVKWNFHSGSDLLVHRNYFINM